MAPDPAARTAASDSHRQSLQSFWNELAVPHPSGKPAQPYPSGNISESLVTLRYWICAAAVDPKTVPPSSPGFLVFDPAAAEDEPEQHRGWRRWLWMFNTLQHLPGMLLATREGLAAGDHNAIIPVSKAKPASGGGQAAEAAGWSEIRDQAMERLLPGLQLLEDTGAPLPDEVGYELAEEGKVVAECELAWTARKVVLLLHEHADHSSAWESRGWKTVIERDDWPAVLGSTLSATASL
jgi:DEAD/DEAH box helicase domain-containing protein